MIFEYSEPILLIICLITLWVAETMVPVIAGRTQRITHNIRNICLGAVASLVGTILFLLILIKTLSWTQANQFGMIHWLQLEGIIGLVFAFIVFDFWQYLWHVLNHKIPFLWRFHIIHHADQQLDVSTGLRFHFGEIALSTLARIVIIAVLGMSIEQLVIYELIALPIILFHHSNIQLPTKLSKALGLIIVTPTISLGTSFHCKKRN